MQVLAEEMRGTDPIAAFDAVLRQATSLSFLRMGDGEFRFLLESQVGDRSDDDYQLESKPSLTSRVKGAAANRASDYQRILQAYENCDFLDLHLHLAVIRDRLDSLQWHRRQDGWQSTGADDSRILPRWFLTHFRNYVTDHKCLFYAGESLLQQALLQDSDYKKCAAQIWPEQHQADFLPLPNFGRHLSRDYEEMKETIVAAIQKNHYDTVFIGASGLAKPLCVEIAASQQVKAIDIGSVLRAMTYSATAGDATWPANHNPYYFSVPLAVYMKATRKAYPHLAPHELIAKANAQLCFDLIHGTAGTSSSTSQVNDLKIEAEKQQKFQTNYCYYIQALVPEFQGNKQVKTQVLELHYWMKQQKLANMISLPDRLSLLVDRLRRKLYR